MTEERLAKLLDRLTVMIPNADEEKLEIILDQVVEDFKAICNRDDVPEGANSVLIQMEAYRYNQLGAEGLSSQSFSGMSENLLSDYPEALKRAMYRFRKVKLV